MKAPIFYRWTDYDLSLLPSAYLRELERGATGMEDWTKRTGYSPGYPAWNLVYYMMLCTLKPDRFNLIVETGTNIGCSAIMIAQALRDSKRPGLLRTVELDAANYAKAQHNVSAAGVSDLVQLYHGDSLATLPAMIDGPLQVAFLDGHHFEEHVIKEFEIVFPHLPPDGLVIFDNTYQIADAGEDQRVNGAVQRIRQRFGGNLINFPIASWYTPGVAIWQKEPF
jgi:predicted O-methyltransferase YrrM